MHPDFYRLYDDLICYPAIIDYEISEPEVDKTAIGNTGKNQVNAIFLNSRIRRHEEKSPKLYLKRFSYPEEKPIVPELQEIQPTLQSIHSDEVFDITKNIVTVDKEITILEQDNISNSSDIFYEDFKKFSYEKDMEFLKNVKSFQLVVPKDSKEATDCVKSLLDDILQNKCFEKPYFEEPQAVIEELEFSNNTLSIVDALAFPNNAKEDMRSDEKDLCACDTKPASKKTVSFEKSPTFFTIGCNNNSCSRKSKQKLVFRKTVGCNTKWDKSVNVSPPCNKKIQVQIANKCQCSQLCMLNVEERYSRYGTGSVDEHRKNKKLQVNLCYCDKPLSSDTQDSKAVDLELLVKQIFNNAAHFIKEKIISEQKLVSILNECMEKINKTAERKVTTNQKTNCTDICAIEKYIADFSYEEYQANMDDVASILNAMIAAIRSGNMGNIHRNCSKDCTDIGSCVDKSNVYSRLYEVKKTPKQYVKFTGCKSWKVSLHPPEASVITSILSSDKHRICGMPCHYNHKSWRNYNSLAASTRRKKMRSGQNITIMKNNDFINLKGLSGNIILLMKNNTKNF